MKHDVMKYKVQNNIIRSNYLVAQSARVFFEDEEANKQREQK